MRFSCVYPHTFSVKTNNEKKAFVLPLGQISLGNSRPYVDQENKIRTRKFFFLICENYKSWLGDPLFSLRAPGLYHIVKDALLIFLTNTRIIIIIAVKL